MEDIPNDLGDLDHYFIILNGNWITLHDKRHREHEEGVVIEPPKPKKGKKRQNQFSYDDDVPFMQDNTHLVIRIKISSSDLLRNGISALRWTMSQMDAQITIDRDQSPQSVIVASVSNVPREASEKGLESTANFYLAMSKESLGKRERSPRLKSLVHFPL